MKKILVAALLFGVTAMAETMTGVISDSNCGAKHGEKLNAACVKKCVEGGASAVFVSDGKVYKIADSSKDKVADHLGEKVKVGGSLKGDTVTIETISMDSGS